MADVSYMINSINEITELTYPSGGCLQMAIMRIAYRYDEINWAEPELHYKHILLYYVWSFQDRNKLDYQWKVNGVVRVKLNMDK